MKVRVTVKDPDVMADAVDEAVAKMRRPDGVDEDEWELIRQERAAKAKRAISEKWMEYSEYLVVEFDTDAGTAVVIPTREQ